ncbi:MAG: type II toxin-antitoxin system Phd/YefM family antitoxin [Hafnia sp.]
MTSRSEARANLKHFMDECAHSDVFVTGNNNDTVVLVSLDRYNEMQAIIGNKPITQTR